MHFKLEVYTGAYRIYSNIYYFGMQVGDNPKVSLLFELMNVLRKSICSPELVNVLIKCIFGV